MLFLHHSGFVSTILVTMLSPSFSSIHTTVTNTASTILLVTVSTPFSSSRSLLSPPFLSLPSSSSCLCHPRSVVSAILITILVLLSPLLIIMLVLLSPLSSSPSSSYYNYHPPVVTTACSVVSTVLALLSQLSLPYCLNCPRPVVTTITFTNVVCGPLLSVIILHIMLKKKKKGVLYM